MPFSLSSRLLAIDGAGAAPFIDSDVSGRLSGDSSLSSGTLRGCSLGVNRPDLALDGIVLRRKNSLLSSLSLGSESLSRFASKRLDLFMCETPNCVDRLSGPCDLAFSAMLIAGASVGFGKGKALNGIDRRSLLLLSREKFASTLSIGD